MSTTMIRHTSHVTRHTSHVRDHLSFQVVKNWLPADSLGMRDTPPLPPGKMAGEGDKGPGAEGWGSRAWVRGRVCGGVPPDDRMSPLKPSLAAKEEGWREGRWGGGVGGLGVRRNQGRRQRASRARTCGGHAACGPGLRCSTYLLPPLRWRMVLHNPYLGCCCCLSNLVAASLEM